MGDLCSLHRADLLVSDACLAETIAIYHLTLGVDGYLVIHRYFGICFRTPAYQCPTELCAPVERDLRLRDCVYRNRAYPRIQAFLQRARS